MLSPLWKSILPRQVPVKKRQTRRLPARRKAGARWAVPQLEVLEDRAVPTTVVTSSTLLFQPQYGVESVISDGGGELQGNVPVYLIFAGSPATGFGYDGSVTAAQITAAVQTMLASGYLNGLSQYGAASQAYLAGTTFNTSCLAGTASGGTAPPYQIVQQTTLDSNGNELNQLSISNPSLTSALNITLTVTYHDYRSPYFNEQSTGSLSFSVAPGGSISPASLLFVNVTIDAENVTGATTTNLTTGSPISLYYPLPSVFTSSNINDLVAATTSDNGGPLPDPQGASPGGVPRDIFLVVTPPGYRTSSGDLGYHDEGNTGGLLDLDPCQYGVVTSASSLNLNALNSLMLTLSHELVETITDPFSASIAGFHSQQGIAVSAGSSFQDGENPGEIADNEAQLYFGYANGAVAMQSYWSRDKNAFIVPGATLQTLAAVQNINILNQSNVLVSGTGVNGDTISVTITDGTHTTTAAATTVSNGIWSVKGIDASGLLDGTVTCTITATDANNNSTTITQTATKITVVPNPKTFVVTDSGDASQKTSGSNDPTDSNGLVSLRSAVAAANFDAGFGGSDTITFAPSLDGAILYLSQGQLELTPAIVNGAVTIMDRNVHGITIDGDQLDRVFAVDAGATAELDSLIIADGKRTGNYPAGIGSQGGGIFNAGSLTLLNDAIVSNQVVGTIRLDGNGTDAKGGGIFNASSGTLTLSNGTILRSNTAAGGAGSAGPPGIDRVPGSSESGGAGVNGGDGGNGMGGGIYNQGILIIQNSSLNNDVAQGGQGGSGGNGGNGGSGANATATLSSGGQGAKGGFAGKGGLGEGGGIYNAGWISMTNCQLTNEKAQGGDGGMGGNGGNGGNGGFSSAGGNGGLATKGGDGGWGQGGAIFNLMGAIDIAGNQTRFYGSAGGGNGGFGGNGGSGGNGGEGYTGTNGGGSGGAGGQPGDAANGGSGGEAAGGAIFSQGPGASIQIKGGQFGGAVTGGDGGNGGNGGNGGDGGPGNPSYPTDGGPGAPGKPAGDGGSGGPASGGALDAKGTTVAVQNASFSGTALGGLGGNGGQGGFGGGGGSGGGSNPLGAGYPGTNGGHGGAGGAGGDAVGGAISYFGDPLTSLVLSNTTVAACLAAGSAGGLGFYGGGGGLGASGGNGPQGGGSGAPGGLPGPAGSAFGGGLYLDGSGTGTSVSVTGCTITLCQANGGTGGGGGGGGDGADAGSSPAAGGKGGASEVGAQGGLGSGGGLWIGNSLLAALTNCTLSSDSATGGDGGSGGRGGSSGFYTTPPEAGAPGGQGGNGWGGGLAVGTRLNNSSNPSPGGFTAVNDTFYGNQAQGGQGGAGGEDGYPAGYNGGRTFASGGQGGSGLGGGIQFAAGGGQLTNDTLTANTATRGGGGASGTTPSTGNPGDGLGGGIDAAGGTTVAVLNSLLAGNTGGYVFVNPAMMSVDVAGAFVSQGNNLVGFDEDSTGFGAGNGDTVLNGTGVNLLLGPLHDNGGPAQTCALLPGSPAIDGGSATGAPATDQRGVPRGNPPDIGAYEYVAPSSISVGTSNNSSVFGQAVTLTATVVADPSDPGMPTGTVTFKESTNVLGTSTLATDPGTDLATATLTTSALSVGSVPRIYAFYSGDNDYLSSDTTSAPLAVQVNPDDTTTTLALSAATIDSGQSVTLTASVAAKSPGSGTPTQSVDFYADSGLLGTGVLALDPRSGLAQATLTISALHPGSHTIYASYFPGDGNFNSSTSAPVSLTVLQSQTITFAALADKNYGDASFLLNATASSGLPVVYQVLSGPATITGNTLTITGTGSVTVEASQSGDGATYTAAMPVDQSFTVHKAHLRVTADNQSRLYGQSNPALTATITGFANGETLARSGIIGSPALSTTATGTSPVGSYPIGVDVSGMSAGNYDFTAVNGQLTINKAHLTITADNKTRGVGQADPVFTATITGFVNGETLATSGVSGAPAFSTTATPTSPVGLYPITPTQGTLKASNYDFTTFVPGSLQILLASKISLQSSKSPSVFGQPITLTATVAAVSGSGTLAGTVTFLDGSRTLQTVTLSGGKVIFTTAALGAGSHSLTAVYSGSTTFAGSTSSALTQTVKSATTRVTLSSSANPATFGQLVTLTARVSVLTPSSATPSGTVTFKDGATVLGTATLTNGSATFRPAALAVGQHNLTAVFADDTDNDAGSTSATVAETVNKTTTRVVLTPSSSPVVAGQTVSLTATISVVSLGAATPSGTVTFKDGTTVLGTVPVVNGVATFQTSQLAAGRHTLTAVYSGDAQNGGNTSVAVTEVVLRASKITLQSSLNPSLLSQPITLTATVTPTTGTGTATGTVTFLDGDVVLGKGTLSSGKAKLLNVKLGPGGHNLTAKYGGDTVFAGSLSDILSQMVNGGA